MFVQPTLSAIFRSFGESYLTRRRVAAETIKDVVGDPKRLGAGPAFTSVLHTWTQELAECARPDVPVNLTPARPRPTTNTRTRQFPP